MNENKFTDKEYLTKNQYKNDENLNARIYVHKHFSTNNQGLPRWIFSQFNQPPECNILEVGCGTGDLWLENAESIPDGWRITLADLSAGMIEKAQGNLCNVNQITNFDQFDVQQIPYDDGQFDAVIANFMLYHVPDITKAIAEIHRVLKPGGKLFAATMGKTHMQELRNLEQDFDLEANPITASNLFGLENGAGLLEECFAHIETLRYADGLVVTEAAPLVAYVLSTDRSAKIRDNDDKLAEVIREEIEKNGAFRITKDPGMFVATKSDFSLPASN